MYRYDTMKECLALHCTQTHPILQRKGLLVAKPEIIKISVDEEPKVLVSAPAGIWNTELAKDRHEPVHWLWDGLLASGATTLLTGSWKAAGKTTLVSLL